MSDFSLSKVAPFLEKDAKTLRRWCEAGHVPGAHQTAGGHWRIPGKTPLDASKRVLRPANARRRRENAYPPDAGSFVEAGMTPRQAWVECSEIEAALVRHKRVILSGGSAYPIDTKCQKIAFLRHFFDSAAESWHDGAEDFFARYSGRTGTYSEIPPRLRYWTPQRIAKLVGWSARSLYRHFPDWRARLRKRALRTYRMAFDGADYSPGETWTPGDVDSFARGIDARLGWSEAA